ncbi:MAG: class I SAM-dependent methyltransferase [Dehalococcoidia bacterium]
MATGPSSQSLNDHYGRKGLDAAIFAGLRAAGKNPDAPALDDLVPIDQFHTGQKDATLALLRLANLQPQMRVLDVGGGLGGAARTIASEVGCQVTVLDLTEEFCRVGELLTERTGLSDRVRFRHGSAVDMPFANESFEAVWSQQSSMNIADKERLYGEISRVLRPGGRLAFQEITAGPVGPIHLPVPWASEPSMSHLELPETVRALLHGRGLKELVWQDVSESMKTQRPPRPDPAVAPRSLPPLGLHLILGDDFMTMMRNANRNLEEQRMIFIRAVFERSQPREEDLNA